MPLVHILSSGAWPPPMAAAPWNPPFMSSRPSHRHFHNHITDPRFCLPLCYFTTTTHSLPTVGPVAPIYCSSAALPPFFIASCARLLRHPARSPPPQHCSSLSGAATAMELSDVSLLLAAALVAVLWWRRCSRTGGGAKNLPPGPPGWPVVGNLFQVALQRRPFMYVVRDLRERYGPIFTMRMGQRTLVIITSPELIHEALVQRGPQFASRPEDSPTRLLFSVGKCTVNSAPYGPLWRALRRNFVAEIVTPAKVRQFGWIRDWAIENHLRRLRREREEAAAGAVEVMANCRLTVCSILACICFGARVPEATVQQIEAVMKEVMMMSTLKLPDFLPALTPLFRGQLDAARNLRKRQMALLAPLVRDRLAFVRCGGDHGRYAGDAEMVSPPGSAYVDSLFELDPAGRGPLGEGELVTLCSEVMSAGTDTSTTALEWALLHLVLDQGIQERVYDEIASRLGAAAGDGRAAKITESDVENMPYLQAVVKETLRRHPPSHFVLSHAATEDTELGGYHIPAGATVEFYTAWLTENPAAWKDPDAFRPERFLEGGDGWDTDLTGARGVRMMPFGVGRRICPAASLGMLHIQLMLARMVWEFLWLPVPGEAPPTTEETFAFTMVMKNPLRAAIMDRQH